MLPNRLRIPLPVLHRGQAIACKAPTQHVRFQNKHRTPLGQHMHSLWGQLLLTVQPVTEVDAADAAIGVHLHTQCLHVVGAYRTQGQSSTFVRQDVPACAWHAHDCLLHPCCTQYILAHHTCALSSQFKSRNCCTPHSKHAQLEAWTELQLVLVC
jgi:hypothetical protein